MFSALFTKTHRITLIMNAAKTFKRLTVTPKNVAKPMLVLMDANILVLGLWAGLDPLRYETEIVQQDLFDTEVETYSFCTSDHPLPYILTLVFISVGSLVYAVYEAWRAKDISTEFAESEFIFKILIDILLVCFVGIPVMVIARDSPQAYYYVFSALIFLVATLVLGLIFVPKIVASREKKTERPSNQVLWSQTSCTSASSENSYMGGGVQVYTKPKARIELEKENAKLIEKQESYERKIQALEEQLKLAGQDGNSEEILANASEEGLMNDDMGLTVSDTDDA